MPKIICTISPKTKHLKGVDLVRINGSFGNNNSILDLIRRAKNDFKANVLLDIPGDRKKHRTNSYSDEQIIAIAQKAKVDFVGISYVNSALDVNRIRKKLKPAPIKIIAKIETKEALNHLDDIVQAADMIMIDRGDLAHAIGFENLPRMQKRIIRKCNFIGRPVIVATELLKSMINDSSPSKAEILDIANAISDGADYLMLSEETAIGRYPQHAIDVLTKLINKLTDNYKIIILSAGTSPMLGSLTADSNISLVDIGGGETILNNQLKALRKNGIHDEDIIVATGKANTLINKELKNSDIQIIFNPWYESTNMLTTIWMAKDQIKSGFIVIYGDVIFESEILRRIINNKNDIVLGVEQKLCDEEAEKICVKDNIMTLHQTYNELPEPKHKCIPAREAFGEFIGIAKFNRLGANLLFKEMNEIMHQQKFNTYLMTSFEHLVMKNVKLNIEKINGLLWNDNDTIYDLKLTKNKIFPAIKKSKWEK